LQEVPEVYVLVLCFEREEGNRRVGMGVHTSGVAAVGWVSVALDDALHGSWDWLGGGKGDEGDDGREGDEDDVGGMHGEVLVLLC
jgi:hypothetical protein